jgi:hypothetical protein
VLAFWELRREERDDGRRGVVGRDGRRVREVDRERSRWGIGFDAIEAIVYRVFVARLESGECLLMLSRRVQK